MGYVEEIIIAFGVIFLIGLIIGLLLLFFSYLSDFFIDYNSKKVNNDILEKYNNLNREIITQTKRHTINYSENKVKKNSNFDVDFDVNVANSIVKTEVVYTE